MDDSTDTTGAEPTPSWAEISVGISYSHDQIACCMTCEFCKQRQCHRFPPVRRWFRSRWPSVLAGEWCGEWSLTRMFRKKAAEAAKEEK